MGRRSDIQEELRALGVTPSKARGQNFLFDPKGVETVLRFAAVAAGSNICEIGPGLGAISLPLAESANSYLAIEIEEKFADRLRRELAAFPQAEVLCADVREVKLPERRWTVVSNVPYSISSQVILWLLEQSQFLESATLLLQREFSERVGAPPGGKDYGSLSVQSQLVADVKLGPRLGGQLFYPPAEVESRLVRLDFLGQPRFDVKNHERFRAVVRAGFGKRRKTLLNALGAADLFETHVDGESMLRSLGIDPKRRAETLSVHEFVIIANALEDER